MTALFVSSHPDVLAAWENAKLRYIAWDGSVTRFVDRFQGFESVTVQSVRGYKLIGFSSCPGPGWVHNGDVWEPDGTDAALAAEFGLLQVDGVTDLPGGMPNDVNGIEPRILFTSQTDIGPRLWVEWIDDAMQELDVEPGVWQQGEIAELNALWPHR